MKSQSVIKGFAASITLAFVTAVGAPMVAEAHHVPETDHSAFACKRDDLAAWKKKSAVEKIAHQDELVEMTVPAQVFVLNLGQNKQGQSNGSGAVVDSEKGYIITNHHVIEGSTGISITTFDSKGHTIPGGTYDAKVIGSDPEADIALLQITDKDAPQIPCLPFGDSSKVKAGQHVLTIGNPFGLKSNVTAGIVSSTDRRSAFPGVSPVQDMIQIDAAVNPGNSGGPLVNMDGEMVGTNTMIFVAPPEDPRFPPTAAFTGNAFAVESNLSKNIASRLLKGEKITHGLLGIGVKDVSKEQAKAAGLKEPIGVIISGHEDPLTKQHVSGVAPGGSGDKAGLKEDDIIRNFGGHDVKNMEELRYLVSNTPANFKTDITVIRDGKEMKFEVTTGAMQPNNEAESPRRRGRPRPGPGPFGGPEGPEDQGPGGPFSQPPAPQPRGKAPQQQAPQGQLPPGNGGPQFFFGPGSKPELHFHYNGQAQPNAPQAATPQQQAPEQGPSDIPPGFFAPGGGEDGGQPPADEGAMPPGPYGGAPQQELPQGPFGPQ